MAVERIERMARMPIAGLGEGSGRKQPGLDLSASPDSHHRVQHVPTASSPGLSGTLAGRWIERIKVNRVWREERDGRVFWMKQRRRGVKPVLRVANAFLRAAGAPMRTIVCPEQWQHFEVASFLALHGAEGFQSMAEGTWTAGAEELPGINLTIPLDTGAMTPGMAAAAGAELRRAHGIHSRWYGAAWSHGDAHAGNFIHDTAAGRARMIDFEVSHDPSLPETLRHADDVLVFLQDLVGRIDSTLWLSCARAFLEGYAEERIVRRAVALLRPPTGIAAQLWWRIRTGFSPTEVLEERLRTL